MFIMYNIEMGFLLKWKAYIIYADTLKQLGTKMNELNTSLIFLKQEPLNLRDVRIINYNPEDEIVCCF